MHPQGRCSLGYLDYRCGGQDNPRVHSAPVVRMTLVNDLGPEYEVKNRTPFPLIPMELPILLSLNFSIWYLSGNRQKVSQTDKWNCRSTAHGEVVEACLRCCHECQMPPACGAGHCDR